MRIASVALLLVTAVSAVAAEPYLGVWAHSTANCEADPRKTEDAPFRISRKQVEGSTEWGCEIKRTVKDGTGWKASLSSDMEGDSYRREVKWTVSLWAP